MKKIKTTILLSLLLPVLVQAQAQSLDRTVNITNEYKAQVLPVHKQEVQTQIPDSLLNFDYKFDYSVFDTPYKGAYEFSPYRIGLNPEALADRASRFYLKAGAGYSLHPELRAVWTPLHKGKVRFSLHQDLTGFYGKYRGLKLLSNDSDYSESMTTVRGRRYDGYDLAENFGLDFRYCGKRTDIALTADYDGVFAGWENTSTNLNKLSLGARVRSTAKAKGSFVYDFALDASTLGDYTHAKHLLEPLGICENELRANGRFGPVFKLDKGRILLDFDLTAFSRKAPVELGGPSFIWNIRPHYDLRIWVFNFNLGVRMGGAGSFIIRPDVQVRVPVKAANLELAASVTGGVKSQSYWSLKQPKHRFCLLATTDFKESCDSWNALFYVRGSIAGRFQYKAETGYRNVLSEPFSAIKLVDDKLTPTLVFSGSKQFYASVWGAWRSEHITASGEFRYRNTRGLEGSGAVMTAPFSGTASVTGNIKHRVFFGLSLDAESDKTVTLPGVTTFIPAYFDLGVRAEYRLSRKLTFYLKGDNLFNEAVQKIPFVVEDGINFTAGIVLKLQ